MSRRMNHQERRERRRRIAEYAAEHGLASAARAFGVSITTASSSCSEYNIKPLCDERLTVRFSSYEVIADLLRGLSDSLIAKKHNMSRQRVNSVRNKCIEVGIPVPNI